MASLVKILESAVTINDLLELLVLNSWVLEFLKACSYNWYCSGKQAYNKSFEGLQTIAIDLRHTRPSLFSSQGMQANSRTIPGSRLDLVQIAKHDDMEIQLFQYISMGLSMKTIYTAGIIMVSRIFRVVAMESVLISLE